MKTLEQTQFIIELQQLLKKYDAQICIVDNGGNLMPSHEIEVEFKDGFLNLGIYIDAKKEL